MKHVTFMAVLVTAFAFAPLVAQDLEMELQRAIQKQAVSGDLKSAIAAYQGIVNRAGTNDELAARALVRMADAYRMLGDSEARRIYERILRDFPEQKEAVAQARSGLSGLISPTRSTGRSTRQLWIGADTMGSVSGDGRYLSFTDWETGDLAVRDLVAGTSRRLTNTGGWSASGDYAEISAMSPDGQAIAYAWFVDKPVDDQYYELRLLSLAGKTPARILHRGEPALWIAPYAWTPDSRSVIAYRSFQKDKEKVEQIVAISTADGSLRIVRSVDSQPRRITVSPDGRYVAYDAVAGAADVRDIVIAPLDGTGRPVRVPHPADDASPLWAPDGQRLLFTSDRTSQASLWSIRVAGGKPAGEPELVDPRISSFVGMDRNGGLYYPTGGNHRNVYVTPVGPDMRTVAQASLFTDRFVNTAHGGAWSPDGRYYAFHASRAPGSGPGSGVVVIRDVATGAEREVVPSVSITKAAAVALRWFPDGQSLLVAAPDPTRGVKYVRVDSRTGTAQPLTQTRAGAPVAGSPALSPDGQAIYYLEPAGENQGHRLVRYELSSRQVSPILTAHMTAFALSPDGTQVAALEGLTDSPDRRMRLIVAPVTGGEGRMLFEAKDWYDGSRFGTLAWSRNGQFVMFVPPEKNNTSTLWRVGVAGTPAETTGVSVTGRIKAIDEIPGGGRLAYSVIAAQPTELWVLENFLPKPAASK